MKDFVKLIALVTMVVFVYGCASLSSFSFMSSSTTSLTSSSLAEARQLRARGITIAGTVEGGNYLLTPTSITGEIMSVVLPIAGEADEGLTPFGHFRPDIAPANSVLYPFDLNVTTTLESDNVSLKPGAAGGQCNQILLMFGYFDVEFTQDTETKIVRFCYGDADPYVRGDKLLKNADGASTGSFYWYDTTAEAFIIESGTRPDYPAVNTFVRDYTDEIRPEMHYYLLGGQLVNNTDYDGTTQDYITLTNTLIEDRNLSFTIDFDVQNVVVMTGVTSEADFDALTDAQLIDKFDMKQNVSDWGNTELYCSIVYTSTPKY